MSTEKIPDYDNLRAGEIGAGVRLNVAHIDSPRLDLKPDNV